MYVCTYGSQLWGNASNINTTKNYANNHWGTRYFRFENIHRCLGIPPVEDEVSKHTLHPNNFERNLRRAPNRTHLLRNEVGNTYQGHLVLTQST